MAEIISILFNVLLLVPCTNIYEVQYIFNKTDYFNEQISKRISILWYLFSCRNIFMKRSLGITEAVTHGTGI